MKPLRICFRRSYNYYGRVPLRSKYIGGYKHPGRHWWQRYALNTTVFILRPIKEPIRYIERWDPIGNGMKIFISGVVLPIAIWFLVFVECKFFLS